MAGPLDIDDDMQRMVLRKGEATAKGGHAFQRLLQLVETRDSGHVRRAALGPVGPAQPGARLRPTGEGGDRAVGPEVARGALTAGHLGD